jgi:large subunit ribosomal protein L18
MIMNINKKLELQQKRRWRIRRKVSGTADRPRLSVHFSNKHIYAQCVNDKNGSTLVSLSTVDKTLRSEKSSANVKGAGLLGKAFSEKATAAGVSKVVFDRNGRRYHGGVKAFADAARKVGLEF